ncbi:MAG: glutamate--cysteine ligase [Pseudobdellovibrionaceae bacterium]
MTQLRIHQQTIKNMDSIVRWYKDKTKNSFLPVYSSYDIRDSGYKVTNVDANIFPAGFNNICPTDKELSVDIMQKYLDLHYLPGLKNILLITEEHTNNPHYWENVSAIIDILEGCDLNVKVAFPRTVDDGMLMTSTTGKKIPVHSAAQDSALFKTFIPDLVISNNDFSNSYEEWAKNFSYTMNPPRELGWYQRQKSRYFKFYNHLVNEFSDVAQIDPFLMRVETEEFLKFDINDEASRSQLASQVDQMLLKLGRDYSSRGIDQKPFVFVKNNHGTYGLAVIRVGSGQEVLDWTYKSRKKMKAAKGGNDVEEVIIQEGIPSVVKSGDASAEPVVYMIGCELAGGFLRTHAEKSETESLNSPGAVYKKMCVADLQINAQGCPNENVYGWSAKLGLLAIAAEAKEMGIEVKDYIQTSC